MLISLDDIRTYTLQARDGPIGKCADFLFDDQKWAVRYMVADTRKWLPGRKVLVSPHTLQKPESEARQLPITLSREELKNAPDLEQHEPVSRQYEEAYHRHFGYALYWVGTDVWGAYPDARGILEPVEDFELDNVEIEEGHLRSANEVHGYEVHDSAGAKVGKVHDFIVEPGIWAIRWLVVDSGEWMSGRKYFLAPSWTRNIDWVSRQFKLDLDSDSIEKSPDIQPDHPPSREIEAHLHQHYSRPPYW